MMFKNKVPKGYQINVQCCQKENGDLTHLILSKITGDVKKYFLFALTSEGSLKQLATSQTPARLYQIIWPD